MKKRYFPAAPWRRGLATLALCGPLLAVAQSLPLRQAAVLLRDDAAPPASPLATALHRARALTLDVAEARATLAQVPAEGQPGELVVALPRPDGVSARFAIRTTSVMAPELAARYPTIRTYAGRGLDDPTATVRLDLTPAGFHAQVLSTRTGTWYIDPARAGDTQHYLSFFRRDMRPLAVAPCGFQRTKTPGATAPARPRPTPVAPVAADREAGGILRTYRLCVAATGEYVAFHGGTVATAQAAIVTSVNRVVGVYEKELAVRLVLVANNDRVVFPNAATDPYTNNDGGAMLGENQQTLDSLIGPANYDIGHVFSTGGGGVAGYAVVCHAGSKALGVTGSGSPVGDAFDIDYVAHEMGHQFSGSHPFNGTAGACAGNRDPSAAWEPGSGSTIMAYAGICAPQDLQPHSDAYFHVGNFEEMRGFIVTTPCAVLTPTGNNTPVVRVPASGKVLPAGTPFRLTAFATDADGDRLTYSWEELDLGPAGAPAAAQQPGQTPPLFRSFVPDSLPTRYFPRLADLVNNTTTIGEQLPTVSRALTFKCTVRDEHRGPQGVIGGVTSSDSVRLTVTSAAGPFRVQVPNTNMLWTGGQLRTVRWDVAGTTANGVDCATVNIWLSTDGGLTYPTPLAALVPNTGSAQVLLPRTETTQARVMVQAADNYFFDISDANFIITGGVCPAPTSATVTNVDTTSAQVHFAPAPAPGFPSYINTNPPTTTQLASASPFTLTGLQPGTTYTVSVVTSCVTTSTSLATTATFTTASTPRCATPTELTATRLTPTTATLSFLGAAGSFALTTTPATAPLVVGAAPVALTGLTPATTYTVRVVGVCAPGDTSAAATLTFTTPALPPANDRCADALPLPCGGRVTGTTVGATDAGDPTGNCDTDVESGGVFYTLVGNGGPITVSTCDPATDFDTKLMVYVGGCGAFACVGGNDDTDAGGCQLPATVSFASTLGTTYLVFLTGYGGAEGNFGLTATCAGPAATPAALAQPPLQVWPNPTASGQPLHLTLSAPTPRATATLRNVLGQRVAAHSFGGTEADLPTAGLAAGTYLLTVEAAGQPAVVRRVVVTP